MTSSAGPLARQTGDHKSEHPCQRVRIDPYIEDYQQPKDRFCNREKGDWSYYSLGEKYLEFM